MSVISVITISERVAPVIISRSDDERIRQLVPPVVFEYLQNGNLSLNKLAELYDCSPWKIQSAIEDANWLVDLFADYVNYESDRVPLAAIGITPGLARILMRNGLFYVDQWESRPKKMKLIDKQREEKIEKCLKLKLN